MSEDKIQRFNTQPLMIELENVINNGVKSILKDFINRYELLEKTHNKIMRLPSVRNEMNISSYAESESESDDDINNAVNVEQLDKKVADGLREEMSEIDKKLVKMEKKYDEIGPILEKILNKLQSLNDDVKILKQQPKPADKSPIIQPSIVSACENENIQFEIKEDDTKVESEYKESEEEEEAEEEEEEAEEEEEEQEAEEEEEAEEEAEEEEEEEQEEEEEEEAEEEQEEEEEEEEPDADAVETEASDNEEQQEEADEEEEVEEIEIDDVTYYTNNEENGFIYESTEDNDVGEKVGYFKDGEPFFYADEK